MLQTWAFFLPPALQPMILMENVFRRTLPIAFAVMLSLFGALTAPSTLHAQRPDTTGTQPALVPGTPASPQALAPSTHQTGG